MIGLKATALNLVLGASLFAPSAEAFASPHVPSKTTTTTLRMSSTDVESETDVRTGKRIGTSFLPKETVERAMKGSPIEKIKLEKDATSAWVDVYEYARKIREGEMSWEDVEKADLDSVRHTLIILICPCLL